jgi:two-component system OmpR family response regulator
VTTATSGEEALVKLHEKRPDAVVLDVEMPQMNGPALLQKVRELLPEVPAVFMTGYMAHHAGIAEARAATGAAYVGKPVDVDELLRVLGRLIIRR